MPTKPKRLCSCGQIVQGKCPDCEKRRREQRTDGQEFYWTKEWRAFSKSYLAINLLCVLCEAQGVTTRAKQADHWPIPRVRLPREQWCDPACVRAVCASCHARYGVKR
jgi:hypothetical protein